MVNFEISYLGSKRFSWSRGRTMWRFGKLEEPSDVPNQVKRPFVIRIDIVGLIIFGIIVSAWLFTHEKTGQNAAATVSSILGFLGIIILALIKGDQNENRGLLLGQNKELSEIKTKVNGDKDRLVQALESKHAIDMEKLEKNLRAEIHKLEGSKNLLAAANEQLEKQLAELQDEKRQLLAKIGTPQREA